MRGVRSLLLVTTLAVGAVLAGCRSGAPPTGASEGLAGRRQDVTNKYSGVIVLDPQCSDFAAREDQVVCVRNKGADQVTIGKWLIRNRIGRVYHFPEATALSPGSTVRVHTGAGTNSDSELYWNYEFKPVFDSHDQVSLVDDSNVEVDRLTTP